MLRKIWNKHRTASIISLIFFALGLVLTPWALVLILLTAFGGPFIGKMDFLKGSLFSRLSKDQWLNSSVLIGIILLAFNPVSGGLGALFLAAIPLIWVLIKDRSIFDISETNRTKDQTVINENEAKKQLNESSTEESEMKVTGKKLLEIFSSYDDPFWKKAKSCGYTDERDLVDPLIEAIGKEDKPLSDSELKKKKQLIGSLDLPYTVHMRISDYYEYPKSAKLTGEKLLDALRSSTDTGFEDRAHSCGYKGAKDIESPLIEALGKEDAPLSGNELKQKLQLTREFGIPMGLEAKICGFHEESGAKGFDSFYELTQDLLNEDNYVTEESLDQSSLSGEKTIVKSWGTGIMLCIYELTKEDYKNFQSKAEEGELDYDELESGVDFGEQVAPYFEPSITINGNEINESKSLEFLECEFNSSQENVTDKGSFWAVCVENYKGTWGQIELPDDHEFDLSKLVVNKNLITFGDGANAEVLEVANISYADDQYGEFDEHDLEGKSFDWYLVSDEGEVTSV